MCYVVRSWFVQVLLSNLVIVHELSNVRRSIALI